MNRIDKLLSIVSLPSEVKIPTQVKDSVAESLETAQAISDDFRQFEEPEPIHQTPLIELSQRTVPSPSVEEPDEEEYDPEKAARSLVHTLHAVDQVFLNAAVIIKCRSSAGGSKGIERMKTALTKEFAGEELTESDNRLIAKFKEYKQNMELLSQEIRMKEDEVSNLIEVATDYCAETKFNIGPGTALWTNYFGSLATRVTKIIVK